MTGPLPNWLSRLWARLRAPFTRAAGAAGNARQRTGLWGEDVAARHLRKEGYVISGRRVRPDAHGDEIDIVARKGRTLVFVEVKTRQDERFGRPALAVDARKRRALCRGAAAFIRRAGHPDFIYRFDIVEVVGAPDRAEPPVVRHIEDAFRFPPGRRFPSGRRV